MHTRLSIIDHILSNILTHTHIDSIKNTHIETRNKTERVTHCFSNSKHTQYTYSIQSKHQKQRHTHTLQYVRDTELGRWSRYFLYLSLSLSPTATANWSQLSHLLFFLFIPNCFSICLFAIRIDQVQTHTVRLLFLLLLQQTAAAIQNALTLDTLHEINSFDCKSNNSA